MGNVRYPGKTLNEAPVEDWDRNWKESEMGGGRGGSGHSIITRKPRCNTAGGIYTPD